MPSRAAIDAFLAQPTIAFVGVSRDPKAFGNAVYRALKSSERTIHPVNPHTDRIGDDTCYRSLDDLPGPVDGVVVMVPADDAIGVVKDAVRLGIPRVWLHRGGGPGAVSPEAVELCRTHGIEVVDGACPLMFLEPVRGVHRVHRFFSRRRFAA